MNRRVLPCRLGPHRFSLDMSWVDGIRRLEDAGAPTGGVVIDVARRIGLIDVPPEPAVCVRLRNVPRPTELRFSSVATGVTLGAGQIFSLASLMPFLDRPAFTHVVHLPNGPALHLDLPAFVPDLPPSNEPLIAPPAAPSGATGAARIVLLQVPGQTPSKRPLTLGLSAAQTLEVTGDGPRLLLPQAALFHPGFLTWRERPVPILDLGVRLGLTSEPTESAPRMLIAQTGGTPSYVVAIPVLANVRVRTLPVEHMVCERSLPLPTALTLGSVELAEETVAVIDLGACLRGA